MSKSTLQGVQARMETTAGSMTFEFFPDKAPGHVENFVKLAEKGFYDGTGGPGYTIKAEFNDVHHTRGVLSMARSQNPDSAGCQFFVCHGDAGFLDRQYTAFGRLIEGDDTLEAIATAAVQPGGERSKPVKTVKITKVTIQRPAGEGKKS